MMVWLDSGCTEWGFVDEYSVRALTLLVHWLSGCDSRESNGWCGINAQIRLDCLWMCNSSGFAEYETEPLKI